MRTLVRCVIAGLLLAAAATAEQLPGQAITWADFNYVRSVTSSVNKVYFATTNGIIRYNKLERRWELPLTGADGLNGESIQRIWVERFDDRLYVQTTVSYYEYDLTFDRWYPITELPQIDNPISRVPAPEDLMPPIGGTYLGNGQLTDPGGGTYSIREIIDDNSGDLWIGTWGYGPAKANSSSRLMELLPYGLLSDNVYTLVKVDSLLWMSGLAANSPRTGITMFDPPNNSFSYMESGQTLNFPSADITALAVSDVKVYAGTTDGLYILDRQTQHVLRHLYGRRELVDDEILSLKIVGDSLFVGTGGGLNVIRMDKDSIGQVYPSVFFNHAIYDLEYENGHVWIGSSIGAYRLTLGSGEMSRFQAPTGFLFSNVYDITSAGTQLWMGSDGGLLSVDVTTGAMQTYRSIWSRNVRRPIAANERIAAISTERGVTIFFLDKQDHSREFSTDDGLPSSTVYTLLLDGDYLWIGSDHGLTRFWWNNPNRID